MKTGLKALTGMIYCGALAITALGYPAGARAQAAAAAPPDAAALQGEIEALKRMLPDQAHVMSDVDYHFSNLWFAARQRNWPLAEFYLGETRSHLNWAVRMRPVRKLANGADLDLRPILEGVEATVLANANSAIKAHDLRGFEEAYRGTMMQCYGCHMAAEKPYLRLHIPETPASRMVDPRPPGK
jgi:hypothetical protein